MKLRGFSRGVLWLFLMFPFTDTTEKFCLLLAENYYEQLYCEVKAMGRGHRLPSLLDFRRNNALPHALSLKRPAAKVGIEVVLPKRKSAPSRETAPKRTQSKIVHINREMDSDGDLRQCSFYAESIQCADDSYYLVGNEGNRKLEKGALADSNRMDIPIYSGLLSDQRALNQYLTRAYRQYFCLTM